MLSDLNQDEEICVSWWGRDVFTDEDGNQIPEEKWLIAVEDFDANEGYATANQIVWDLLNYAMTGEGEF